MADAKPSFENVLCCDKIIFVLIKSNGSIVMEYHVVEKLDTAMESNNLRDKQPNGQIFFLASGFSFTNIHDSQHSKRRERLFL